MKKKKLFTKLAAGAMAFALCVNGLGTAMVSKAANEIYTNVYTNEDGGHTYIYSEDDPLFAATHYHIFAEKKASTSTHTNGNIATNELSTGSNCGSRILHDGWYPEYTYIRKVTNSSVLDFSSVDLVNTTRENTAVVFGKETTVYSNGAEHFITIGTGVTSKMEPVQTIYTEDSNTRFIDLEGEFNKLRTLSVGLASEPETAAVAYRENVVTLPKDSTDTMYIDLSPSDFYDSRAFVVKGTNFSKGQAIVVNVNLGTLKEYKLPFNQVNIEVEGEENKFYPSDEDWEELTGHGNILWNFYATDEYGNKTTYKGTITTCSEFKGTVLAPDATIKTPSSNQDGNFIGQNVELGGGETHRWDFGGKLKKYGQETGSLQVTAKNVTNNNPLAKVEVKIYDENSNYVTTLITGDTGESVALSNITLGTIYTAEVSYIPNGYVGAELSGGSYVETTTQQTATVTIDTTNPNQVIGFDFMTTTPVDNKGYFKVTVKNVTTGATVENVTVEIKDSNGSSVTVNGKTNAYGTTTSDELTISNTDSENVYTFGISGIPSNYEIVGVDTNEDGNVDVTTENATDTLTSANPDEVTFYIQEKVDNSPKGSIQIKVWAIEEGVARPIEGARIEVDDEAGNIIELVTVETDKEGETDPVAGLTINDAGVGYVTKYVDAPAGFEIVAASAVTDADKTIIKTAEGVTGDIVIADEGVHTVSLTTANRDAVIYYVLKQTTGSLGVKVVDADGNPVKDVTVQLTDENGNYVVDKDGKFVVDKDTTDVDGCIDEAYNLPTGNKYIAEVVGLPDGYTITTKEKTSEPIAEGTVTWIEFVVSKATEPTGDLDIVVRDQESKDPIGDATVQVKDKTTGEVIKTGTTDSEGHVLIEGLTPGDYIIHVPTVPGYNVPEDNNTPATVTAGVKTDVPVEVEIKEIEPEKGTLDVTIYDEVTGDKISEATIQIKDSEGNVVKEVVTDSTGHFQVELVPGEYTIDTVKVPEGYNEPKDETATVTAGGYTESELKVSTKEDTTEAPTPTPTPETGKLQVTITDKNDPTKPIPGATVVIKNPDGSIKETVTTDENGLTPVIDELKIGETYTIETTKVPDGYSKPTPTTQKITGTELVKVPLQVGRDSGVTSTTGSLYVIITDKNTGNPIPGATVEVSNSAGEKVKTVVTDETGAFTITELKPDTYTIKTTKVPAGYTAPDTQTAAVKSNARTDVHLYVAKGTTTTTDTVVQTGDESNVQAVSMLALMACVGIVVVSIMRKREEI